MRVISSSCHGQIDKPPPLLYIPPVLTFHFLTWMGKYRISQLNAGQLRLLVSFVENKVPGLTNKTVLNAYSKLLRKATAETDKRHEEEVHLVIWTTYPRICTFKDGDILILL